MVSLDGDGLVMNSLIVGRDLGKRHRRMLQAFDKLKCYPEFGRLNFQPTEARQCMPHGQDEQGWHPAGSDWTSTFKGLRESAQFVLSVTCRRLNVRSSQFAVRARVGGANHLQVACEPRVSMADWLV